MMEKKYLIKFQEQISEISAEDLNQDSFNVDFNGAMMIQFDRFDGELFAVNGMNGYGNNIATDIAGLKPEIYAICNELPCY